MAKHRDVYRYILVSDRGYIAPLRMTGPIARPVKANLDMVRKLVSSGCHVHYYEQGYTIPITFDNIRQIFSDKPGDKPKIIKTYPDQSVEETAFDYELGKYVTKVTPPPEPVWHYNNTVETDENSTDAPAEPTVVRVLEDAPIETPPEEEIAFASDDAIVESEENDTAPEETSFECEACTVPPIESEGNDTPPEEVGLKAEDVVLTYQANGKVDETTIDWGALANKDERRALRARIKEINSHIEG